jgi:K+-transporting ATPase ATPase C chain
MFVAMTVICGLIYPLVITGVGQAAFNSKANGSMVSADGRVVGSKLIGQNFTGAKYFHPRPSAAGPQGYDGDASAASNLGPNNKDLLKTVAQRVVAYRKENGLASSVAVPSDAVTASASGLDPEISIANARLQAPRVAQSRGLSTAKVLKLVSDNTGGRDLGVLGDPGVNVLELNLALDRST